MSIARLLIVTSLFALFIPSDAFAAATKPNIVIILADDLGYSDLGCYGGEVKTPHLDALAANGLRYTQFYNSARCCPTRASLMTGLYPHQAGIGRMTHDTGKPGYRGFLTDNTVTIAEVLKTAGYRTGMSGKWHLSLTNEDAGHMKRLNNQEIAQAFSNPASYPVGRGFDFHYGVIWGVINFYDPFSLVQGTEPVKEVPKDYYATDAFTDAAIQFIEAGKPEEPFFLYLAHTAPHWPLQAPEADIAKYADTYKGGWDAVRNARIDRMKKLGLLPADYAVPARTAKGDWDTNETKDWDAHAMAVHAAMVDRMDQGIGRVIETLRKRGQLDNTLILFLSDNGASSEIYPNSGFDRPSQTRDGKKIAYPPGKTVLPGGPETFFYMGPDWASVANAPFRFWKAQVFEGGICTPLIAHWPKGITAKSGGLMPRPGHVMDVMATCVEIAGAEYPKTFAGRSITPIEGKSLVPSFRGDATPAHETLAWEHFNAKAFRKGDLKLVARPNQQWELYDLSKDRAEATNLAAEKPEAVKELSELWSKWAERTQVLPRP